MSHEDVPNRTIVVNLKYRLDRHRDRGGASGSEGVVQWMSGRSQVLSVAQDYAHRAKCHAPACDQQIVGIVIL